MWWCGGCCCDVGQRLRLHVVQMAYKLYRMSLECETECFCNLHIDGEPKRLRPGDSAIWMLMRGHAPENEVPTTVVEFDFEWPEQVRKMAR